MPLYIFSHFIRLPLLLRALFFALCSICIFGVMIHFIEPETYPTIFDGIWWAVITTSTVGYGDYVPNSILGRIAAILLILSGAGFLSYFFISLATTAVTRQNDYVEGRISFKGSGHLLIIGWNERSRQLIHALQQQNHSQSIVLMDESLESNPLSQQIHFIRGPAYQDEVLMKANILGASKVIVTADPNKEEIQSDMHSILTLLAIKGMNQHIPCIVEILTTEQAINAERAGADEIIQPNIVTSFLMQQSIRSQYMVSSFFELLHQLTEKKLLYCCSNCENIGKDFSDIAFRSIGEGKLLIGIKRGETTILNPPTPFPIEEQDMLIYITQ